MEKSRFDLNTIIGLLLIGGILFYYSYTSQPKVDPEAEQATVTDTVKVEEKAAEPVVPQKEVVSEKPDSLAETPKGPFASAIKGEEKFFTLENELLEVVISSKGGQVVKARLKNYQTWDSLPLYLVNDNSAFNINLQGDKVYNTNNLYFQASDVSSGSLNLTLEAEPGKTLQYTYTLEPKKYLLDWTVVSNGMSEMINAESSLSWEMQTFRHEKNLDTEKQKTKLAYHFSDDNDVDDLSATSQDEEEEENIEWVAYSQQFFSTILWNKQSDFNKAGFISNPVEGENHTKVFASRLSLNTTNGELSMPMGLYLGPNKYDLLKKYDNEFHKLIPLGWGIFGWINRGVVINIFDWLEGYGINYGIIILIMAVLIKMVLFPLTYTSYRSMAKMRVLKPEMDELNEKFKDKDPMKKQQATLELYQKAGVNPLGGCIPVLLQMPILLALFNFFPSSIELRQQPFLWANDLSTYDSVLTLPFNIPFYGDHVSLFTLLMTVSTLIYTYMNQQLTGQNQQYPQMKYLIYLMPIVFLGVLNSYPAALSYYYFVANMITFGQQFAIRSFIDEEKIHAKIQERKKQPVKENRFVRRMKEVQEQQNRQARRSGKK